MAIRLSYKQLNMREIIDTHYKYRTEKKQYARLNEEYYYIMKALAAAPWWKRFWVFWVLVNRIRDGKIL